MCTMFIRIRFIYRHYGFELEKNYGLFIKNLASGEETL